MALIKGKIIQANNPARPNLLSQPAPALDTGLINASQQEAQRIIASAQVTAEQTAAAILAAAKAEQSRLLADVQVQMQALNAEKSKIEAMREQVRKQAYDEGIKEAEMIKDEMLNILATFQNAKENVLREAEEEIGSLALLVAEKLLQSEIKRDKTSKTALTKQIRAAISKVVTGKGMVKIMLAPSDMTGAKSLKSALEKTVDEGVRLHLEENETVQAGSCIIETKGGRFDASFNTQLKVLTVALEKYLGAPLVDLNERYATTDEEVDMAAVETLTKSSEPSDADLEALMQDIQSGNLFAEDEDLQTKMDGELYDDDIDLEEDESDSDDDEDEDEDSEQLEDEDDYGAVDDDLEFADEEEAEDDFADEDSEEGDERFPEY